MRQARPYHARVPDRVQLCAQAMSLEEMTEFLSRVAPSSTTRRGGGSRLSSMPGFD